jgi:hypothetical protein
MGDAVVSSAPNRSRRKDFTRGHADSGFDGLGALSRPFPDASFVNGAVSFASWLR